MRQAMRAPYVVQEVVEPAHAVFPLMQYGSLMMKDMVTHLYPHAFGGQVHGANHNQIVMNTSRTTNVG